MKHLKRPDVLRNERKSLSNFNPSRINQTGSFTAKLVCIVSEIYFLYSNALFGSGGNGGTTTGSSAIFFFRN